MSSAVRATAARRAREGSEAAWRGLLAKVLAAAAFFAIATPWVLRPWFLADDLLPHMPGAVGTMADADLYLNVWILAWIAHAALNDPGRLYDGNIFHPAPNAIAGSENMLAHLPVTAPVLALTGSALLMLKALILESFVLSGVAMFLFVHHHTRNAPAALLAGAAYTFTPFRATTIPQPQYLGIQYLPLALLCVDLWLERRRTGWLLGLAAAVALQSLTCVYVGFFTLVATPVYAAVRLLDVRERRGAAAVGILAALAAGVGALLPMALPYLRARAEGMIPVHDPAMIRYFSWPPWLYLSSAFLEKAGVVPVVVVALEVAARLLRRLRSKPARRMPGETHASPARALWAVAAIGVVLSAGPSLSLPGDVALPLPYLALYELVPGFSSVRVPLRFVILVAAALAALAGIAFARLAAGLQPRVRLAAAGVLALACVLLAAPRPTPVMAANLGDHAPEVYRWLEAQSAPGAVLELPSNATDDDVIGNIRNGRYMVASTLHWRPLVNGYTAYPPPLASLYAAAVRELPSRDALRLLVDVAGLRWILVHRDQMSGEEAAPWTRGDVPGLELVRSFGDTEVYAVTLAAQGVSRDEIVARGRTPAATTLEGTPRTPLPEPCRAARLVEVRTPERVSPIPLPRRVPVRFENLSDCAWPGLGVRPEGLVGLTYRWTSPSGRRLPAGPRSRLLHDVPPHATVDTTLMVVPPAGEPGAWRLEAILFQDGVAEPLAVAERQVQLRPLGAVPSDGAS